MDTFSDLFLKLRTPYFINGGLHVHFIIVKVVWIDCTHVNEFSYIVCVIHPAMIFYHKFCRPSIVQMSKWCEKFQIVE